MNMIHVPIRFISESIDVDGRKPPSITIEAGVNFLDVFGVLHLIPEDQTDPVSHSTVPECLVGLRDEQVNQSLYGGSTSFMRLCQGRIHHHHVDLRSIVRRNGAVVLWVVWRPGAYG